MASKKILYFVLFSLSLLSSGCGFNEGVVERDQKSFLMFTGNTQDAVVHIEGFEPIQLSVKSTDSAKAQNILHYEVSPGKHLITVKRFEEVILTRRILLGNGLTKEIKIP